MNACTYKNMGEQEVATKNTCEGWFMRNTNVSNIPLPQRDFVTIS